MLPRELQADALKWPPVGSSPWEATGLPMCWGRSPLLLGEALGWLCRAFRAPSHACSCWECTSVPDAFCASRRLMEMAVLLLEGRPESFCGLVRVPERHFCRAEADFHYVFVRLCSHRGEFGAFCVRVLHKCYPRPLPPANAAVLRCAWEASARLLSRGSSVRALESLQLFTFCWFSEVLDSQECCGLASLEIHLSFVMIHLSLKQSFLFISGLK